MAVYVYDFTLSATYEMGPDDYEPGDLRLDTPEYKTIPFNSIITGLRDKCKKYTFQLERGEGGYLHYQGRFSLKKKVRIEQMIKYQPWVNHCHYSVTSSASHRTNEYVMKEDTRVAGPWEGPNDNTTCIPSQVQNITLRPWQQRILDMSQIYSPRKINIIYDNKGNIGKSILSMYMRCHGFARLIPGTIQDAKDICQLVCCMPVSKCYIIDMPRAIPKIKLNGMYAAIESIKNGHVYDLRYRYSERIFNPPNVFVFTNELPDPAMLSPDRWDVWEVVEDMLYPYTDFLSDDE